MEMLWNVCCHSSQFHGKWVLWYVKKVSVRHTSHVAIPLAFLSLAVVVNAAKTCTWFWYYQNEQHIYFVTLHHFIFQLKKIVNVRTLILCEFKLLFQLNLNFKFAKKHYFFKALVFDLNEKKNWRRSCSLTKSTCSSRIRYKNGSKSIWLAFNKHFVVILFACDSQLIFLIVLDFPLTFHSCLPIGSPIRYALNTNQRLSVWN